MSIFLYYILINSKYHSKKPYYFFYIYHINIKLIKYYGYIKYYNK